MKKLLSKSLKVFSLYAFFVLVCSIPAYYYIVDNIWMNELHEHNKIVAETIKANIHKAYSSDSALDHHIHTWNQLQPDAAIRRAAMVKPDSTYNIYRRNATGINRFHGLVSSFTVNSQPYSLTVETNMEETHETILAITLVTILFFILLLAGLVLLNKRASRRLWQPFYNTLHKIAGFDLNRQQQISFDKTNIAEFETLNNSLQQLINENISTYQQQKEFTENASHELQTPLAIAKSKLDLLLQSQPLNDKQSLLVEESIKALMKVTRINKNLLLLARIENHQFLQKENICLSELLEDCIAPLFDLFAHKSLQIEQHIQSGINIEGNKVLVEILLNNLLLNAARYVNPGGKIIVHLLPGKLRIANTGSISLDTGNLFKRFTAGSPQSPGSGLGLAIVQQICQRYHWQVYYTFENQLHQFCIDF
ncbi:sensor histidine kinase [Chitinophaga flava]|uniref:histidine kinase n=1 Tax=Chitinophaga flava TaxID=2259036 RepID=A0A365Y4R0_9BACT|nr:HAMP domain-containing sensor histidine kinase [Chitinophaga flava]RBL93318.1 sensor histidine kinase [Chitinophaga flava]